VDSPEIKNVMGIDPSATSTGVSVFCTDGSRYTYIITPKELRDCKRLEYIFTSMLSIFKIHPTIDLVCMESPSYGSTHKEFILGEVLGVIKLAITTSTEAGIVYIPPTRVKKYMASSGRASKDDMIRAAKEDGCDSTISDVADSWAIASIGTSILTGKSILGTRASQEVIHDIIKNIKI
jgi:Holliday junction resolvasome RuvABC endonuclease subunit